MQVVNVDQLIAGDILLYHSCGSIGRTIRLLDGTDVNHAGLYMGDCVAEALGGRGLCTNTLAESLRDSVWVMVHRLRDEPPSFDPVGRIARAYLQQKNRYGYEQIVLLAGICLTRRLDLQNGLLRRLVHAAMRSANHWLEQLHGEGREPMICSEFVFRAYDEAVADADDPFSLTILSQESGQPVRKFSGSWSEESDTVTDSPCVHCGSLLAELQMAGTVKSSKTRAWRHSERMAESGHEGDLDSLIERYLAEVDGVKASVTAPVEMENEPTVDDLLVDAEDLVATVAAAARNWRKAVPSKTDVPSAVPQTLANFVTPGDLLQSPSLRPLGVLEL